MCLLASQFAGVEAVTLLDLRERADMSLFDIRAAPWIAARGVAAA
jgi:hypothetical protein